MNDRSGPVFILVGLVLLAIAAAAGPDLTTAFAGFKPLAVRLEHMQ